MISSRGNSLLFVLVAGFAGLGCSDSEVGATVRDPGVNKSLLEKGPGEKEAPAKLSTARHNPLLITDSYKVSHYLQYPPATTWTFGYLENRGVALPGFDKAKFERLKGQFPTIDFERAIFFGLQYIIKEYLTVSITKEMVDEAEELFGAHLKPGLFNREGWMKVVTKHEGRIPMRIRAVREGSVVPVKNVLITAESTDPDLFWLPSWFETMLLRVWYPSAVASLSNFQLQIIRHYMALTCDDFGKFPFMLHDFGGRGVTSAEAAGLGAAAHLLNSMGTDTIEGLVFARKYYAADKMPGFSIPAAEHSTITSWGQTNETDAYRNMLKQFTQNKGDIVAIVSDSYDIENAVANLWGGTLRDEVIAAGGRGATIVIRPDSGDPVVLLPALLRSLADKFGATKNQKGYLVINHNVRMIQGDSVDLEGLPLMLQAITDAGFSVDNLAFGSGGALLQKLNRDTFKTAYKTSAVITDGKFVPVFKNPVTDPGKRSKQAIQDLVMIDGKYATIELSPKGGTSPQFALTPDAHSQLEVVYENGKLTREQTFEEVRATIARAVGWAK